MSRSKIVTLKEFVKIRSGQTLFYVSVTQFGESAVKSMHFVGRRAVTIDLVTKKRLGFIMYVGAYTTEIWDSRLWPKMYPDYKLFWTRRAAERFAKSELSIGKAFWVRRVRKAHFTVEPDKKISNFELEYTEEADMLVGRK